MASIPTLDLSNQGITNVGSLKNKEGYYYLNLSSNNLTEIADLEINPFTNLNITNNQISDWSLSEPFAYRLPYGTATIYTSDNPTSSEGTWFKSILTGKGYTVIS